jgi:hypothetical protein
MDPLLRSALKDWLKYILLVSGVVIFLLGLQFLPMPLVNLKAMTGLFPVLTAGGLFAQHAVPVMVVGGLLVAASFLVRRDA